MLITAVLVDFFVNYGNLCSTAGTSLTAHFACRLLKVQSLYS